MTESSQPNGAPVDLDLVLFGNLAVDDVVDAAGGRTRFGQPGGAVLYAALAARLMDLRVGIVAPAGDDYPLATLEALAVRGIRLEGVRATGRPGLRTWLLYEGGVRRVVHRLDGPTHAEASPTVADLPAGWRARAWHLAPLPLALQVALAGAARSRGIEHLSADPYELLSDPDAPGWPELLDRVDLLLLSEDELARGADRRSPRPVVERLAAGRRLTVALKRAARGGLAREGTSRRWHEWAPRADRVVDATGAGDAFAAGVLAGRLVGEDLGRAIERGVVAASFAIEAEGADGLLSATRESAAARLDSWFG